MSYRTLLGYSEVMDSFEKRPDHQPKLTGTSRSFGAAVSSLFKSTSHVEQSVEDIDSYSSKEDSADDPVLTTSSTIIDYKNQFPTNSVGKVSKELLMEDNEAFLLARKKKWMNAKKGQMMGKAGHQKKWKYRTKGKGKK